MRLLVDNALSPIVAQGLRDAGHDALHLRDLTAPSAKDEEVLELAAAQDRILVSADTDFAQMLAKREATKPSFILLKPNLETIEQQILTLVRNLPQLERELEIGCVAVIEGFRVRVRRLPIPNPDR